MLSFSDLPSTASRIHVYRKIFAPHRRRMKEYRAHEANVHSISWNCDGKFLASGSFDQIVCLFCLSSGSLKRLNTFIGHEASIEQLCWHRIHPDLFCSTGSDKTVRMWDTRQSKCCSVIDTKGENLYIRWSLDGETVVVSDRRDLVSFIDTRTRKIRMTKQFSCEVNEFNWDNSGKLLFITSGKGQILILTYPEMESLHVAKGHTDTCVSIDFERTGKHFAVGSEDATVSLWLVNSFACVRIIPRLKWPVRAVHFSHDGELLAAASDDMFIDVSEVSTGHEVLQIPVRASTNTVAWHPQRYILAFAGDTECAYTHRDYVGMIRVWGLS